MGNNDKPLVSVLMPVYNGEKFLAETIEKTLQADIPPTKE